MTVVEYGPGAGWYTEILAPLLSAQGKLWVTTADPAGPPEVRATFYAERLDLFLKKSPELYGQVGRAISPPEAPRLDLKDEVDLALVIRGMHGMVRRDQLGIWLDEIHKSLKEGGTLGVVQHRALDGADPKKSADSGYLPEAWLIEQITAHGYELSEKSELLANPQDTTDHPEGVWTLPPTLRLGEQDRAKYEKIGESDRMLLRFKKVSAQ
jgi:predicted methyltransferase